jgi:hypothetical protein
LDCITQLSKRNVKTALFSQIRRGSIISFPVVWAIFARFFAPTANFYLEVKVRPPSFDANAKFAEGVIGFAICNYCMALPPSFDVNVKFAEGVTQQET